MPEQARPNLLYIHSDQHNAAVTGCYGDAHVRTPHLDRLARDGALFSSAYCCSPICVPSRMATLSGRHPWQNEVWSNSHVLNSSVPTLAHSMGVAGYRPALIGRMHAVGPDQLHGYCERLVGDHSANFPGIPMAHRGALQGTAGPERISLRNSGAGQSGYQVHDEDVTAAAVDWLNRLGVRRRAGVDDGPFSLSVGYMLPHPPYVARRGDYERYADTLPPPRKPREFADEAHPYLRRWRETTDLTDVSVDETRRSRAAYWGLVERMDAMIGEILAALAANDLERDTLIVYSSDHGDMVGEHGLWWKHVFYEESVRVPLIMAWPGRFAGGQRCERVVSALDLSATLLDAMAAPALPDSPGRSLLPLLQGDAASVDWNDEAFSEYCADRYAPDNEAFVRMLRQDEWKLVYYYGWPAQLFNLREDPDEGVDRAGDPACQGVLGEMRARVLQDWRPERIRARMAELRADCDLQAQWAAATLPEEHIRWHLLPEMEFLDDD